jgi:hypothetical protein
MKPKDAKQAIVKTDVVRTRKNDIIHYKHGHVTVQMDEKGNLDIWGKHDIAYSKTIMFWDVEDFIVAVNAVVEAARESRRT